MTLVIPIKDLHNATETSNIAHETQESRINRIDQAIYESEQEIANGAESVDAETVFAELEKKHF